MADGFIVFVGVSGSVGQFMQTQAWQRKFEHKRELPGLTAFPQLVQNQSVQYGQTNLCGSGSNDDIVCLVFGSWCSVIEGQVPHFQIL